MFEYLAIPGAAVSLVYLNHRSICHVLKRGFYVARDNGGAPRFQLAGAARVLDGKLTKGDALGLRLLSLLARVNAPANAAQNIVRFILRLLQRVDAVRSNRHGDHASAIPFEHDECLCALIGNA